MSPVFNWGKMHQLYLQSNCAKPLWLSRFRQPIPFVLLLQTLAV